ncbi:hypothetical protein FACS1894216_07010 [Synergistales bacterium]|nr:hypothetical protein FACS1894216_07010 [Synergistales bacterium]
MADKMNINRAWETLFARYDIVERAAREGSFRISSSEINTVKEARLMAKFDRSSQLPEIFKANKLSILPISRGEYIIGSFATHTRVIYPGAKPTPVVDPRLETLDSSNLYSEASALLFAYNSGIIQNIMNTSKVAFTVFGRMSSGSFDYTIEDCHALGISRNISVQNAQIEIDAGYESAEAFCVCEAKNIAADELLIRQLYYPYRLWATKISKPIVPLFLTFSNDIFHAFIYSFEDVTNYNSIKLMEHRAYTFADEDISLAEVIELWKNIKTLEEPQAPFPQADSFELIFDLLSVLADGALTRDEITLKYAFVDRQTNYYIAACEYLGFVGRGNNTEGEREFFLTPEAKRIMMLRYKQKHMEVIKKVLECPVFNRAFGMALNGGELPDKNMVCQIMRESNLSINETTIDRRSSTVRGWLDWIFRISAAE